MITGISLQARRPTCVRLPLGFVDLQSLPPAGWCAECGAEVYAHDSRLCRRCRKERKKHYGKKRSAQSVPDMYPGAEPGRVRK